jgi:protein phosphatase
MASTVALVLVQDRTLFVGHLGDSRVYLGRAGAMRRLTRDHSVVQRMVDDAIITEDEARTHPSGHILTQSLGQEGAELEESVVGLDAGDMVLICSDGLWAYVEERRLAEALTSPDVSVATAADSLLDQALAAGASDNVSVALLRVGAARPIVSPRASDMKTGRTRRTLLVVSTIMLVALIVWLLIRFVTI